MFKLSPSVLRIIAKEKNLRKSSFNVDVVLEFSCALLDFVRLGVRLLEPKLKRLSLLADL